MILHHEPRTRWLVSAALVLASSPFKPNARVLLHFALDVDEREIAIEGQVRRIENE